MDLQREGAGDKVILGFLRSTEGTMSSLSTPNTHPWPPITQTLSESIVSSGLGICSYSGGKDLSFSEAVNFTRASQPLTEVVQPQHSL